MSDETHHDGLPRNLSVQRERTDIDSSRVFWFALGLIGLVIVTAVSVWGLLGAFQRSPLPGADAPWPVRTEERHPLPPSPRLEGLDLDRSEPTVGRMAAGSARQQIEAEEDRLRRYGWVDRRAGVIHIPIEIAMKRLANKLPARKGTPISEYLQTPSSSSSGRKPRGETR